MLDDLRSLVCRTVVHDDPTLWRNCLGDHGGEGLLNKSFLVVRRGDEDVFHTQEVRGQLRVRKNLQLGERTGVRNQEAVINLTLCINEFFVFIRADSLD